MRAGKLFFSILLVLAACAGAVSPVLAHALLSHANPAPNAILPQSPARVDLEFSETIAPVLSTIQVYDSNGTKINTQDAQVDPASPEHLVLLLPQLSDGIYTVAWKVTSLTDGHRTTGSYPFAVGGVDQSALASQKQTTNTDLPFSTLLSKWLMLLSAALLVGRLPFQILVWNSALKSAGASTQIPQQTIPAEPPVFTNISIIGLVGLFLANAISLLSQAGQMLSAELTWPWSPETGQILLESRLGLVWLARLAICLVCVLITIQPRSSWKSLALFISSLGLLLTISLTSHAATDSQSWLPIFADWAHIFGMSLWFGGLAYLIASLRELKKLESIYQTRLVSLAIKRFSAMALFSVGMVGITGLYAATLRIGSTQALLTTLYGSSMLVKQVFVGLLMVIAAINLLYISPRLDRSRIAGADNTKMIARFARILLIEAALACLLLLSVSYLTYLPPARVNPPQPGLQDTLKVDDLAVKISITPGVVGQNNFSLDLAANGQPLVAPREVLLRFTSSKPGIPPAEAKLADDGTGKFSASGAYLSLPGQWQIQAVVRRDGKFDEFANFSFSLGSVQVEDRTTNFAGVLLVIVAFLFILIMFTWPGTGLMRYSLGSMLGLALIGAGIVFMLRAPVKATPVSSLPASNASVQSGAALFAVHCASCHGDMGMGDGPLAKSLNPRPADLMEQAMPGVHTDEQLYEWISNGFPGSAMPAFKTSLTDNQRWDLVHFIRTLATQQH